MKSARASRQYGDKRALLFFEAITFGSGLLGLLMGGIFGYRSLVRPPLMLPELLIPVVWSVLYLGLGFAAYRIWEINDIDSVRVLRLYLLSLLVNALYSLFFFRLEWRLFSFFWMLLLVALVSVVMAGFKYICRSAYLLSLPYLFWLIYTAYLDLGFYLLNIG